MKRRSSSGRVRRISRSVSGCLICAALSYAPWDYGATGAEELNAQLFFDADYELFLPLT